MAALGRTAEHSTQVLSREIQDIGGAWLFDPDDD